MSDKTDILIVDDERINLKILEGILKEFDLNIVKAMSGKDALSSLAEHDFALVLLDVMMPGINGFETAERMRNSEKHNHIPIIFVTAISKEQKHVFKGYELGAVDYLFKPVEPEILRGKVKIFVDLHRKQRQLEKTKLDLELTVSELEKSKNALGLSEERYRTVADYAYDWEWWVDPDDNVLYVSPSCERISGYGPEKFLESPDALMNLVHEEDREAWSQFMGDKDRTSGHALDFRMIDNEGRMMWVNQVNYAASSPEGKYLGLRCSLRDITDRKNMEIQLRHQALHDPLTEIANRTLLLDRIQQAVERGKRTSDYNYAVIFLDIDRFKIVNDSLGHSFGDKLLVNVSQRLLECVRGVDTVSRFGGDEFVIVLEDLESPREAIFVGKRIRSSLQEVFEVDGHEIRITASMGIYLNVGDEENSKSEELIQKANIAMYRAKESGRNKFQVFNQAMLAQAAKLLKLENDLRRGLIANEFFMVYQPIMSLEDGSLTGFEALVRWEHPEHGLVSPGEFIPVAEDTGLIIELGQWVLMETCRTASAWRRKIPEAQDIIVSVNLSAKQFSKQDLVRNITDVLETTGMPPDRLKLEITETAVMDNAEKSALMLNMLKDEGLTLSIDDFGTGYSSMSYLQKLPVDNLKIDLSFVRRMDHGPENIEIVRAIINLAHALRIKVVAEGIERPEQRTILMSLQCEYGQGYLFSKPLTKDKAEEFIRKNLS